MNMVKLKAGGDLEGNQEGFAAMVVALVLVLVLSLITVGFAQLMRSNQESALNKQLSGQAYYAAESGINDAAQAYAAGYTLPKTTCPALTSSATGANYLSTSTVNTSTNTSIACLLTDPTPSDIQYDVLQSQANVIEAQGCSATSTTNPVSGCGGYSASNVGYINFSWNDNSGSAAVAPSCSNVYPEAQTTSSDTAWPYENILRIELIPIGAGNITRSSLVSSTYTAFLCPGGASSQAAATYTVNSGASGANSGAVLSGYCNTSVGSPPYNCNISLNVGSLSDATYFIIMKGVYSTQIDATITMKDTASPTPNNLNIGDAQMIVDSTGQAQNVLKRIEARVPETSQYNMPDAVVQGEVCKQLQLVPSSSQLGQSNDASPCDTYR